MPYVTSTSEPKQQTTYIKGFKKALVTIESPNLIADNALSMAKNVMLEVDGITRRYGTTKQYDQGSASYVYGSIGFYISATNTRQFIRLANGQIQKLVGNNWTAVGGTYSNVDMNFVVARGKVYTYNGTEAMTNYDGTTITTYSALATPTNLTVAPQGSAGSTAYSYSVSAFGPTGETLAITAVAISNGNATLSASNYNKLDWVATAGATGYNIYGNKTTGLGRSYMATVYAVTYNDTGADIPDGTKLEPDSNNTGGMKAKAAFYHPTLDRQFAIGCYEGTTFKASRLYYTGVLNFVDSYAGGSFGGGWVDIGADDGGEILDAKPYKNTVIVLKNTGVYQFAFTSTGLPSVAVVTTSHGGVGFRASHAVDNDVVYVGQKFNRIAVFTIGQQAGFITTEVRTNEISVDISNELKNVNRGKFSNICSFFADDKFGFAFTSSGNTENDRGYVLDTRFGGWVYWDSDPMKVNHYVTYDDGTNIYLFGGSNSDGYMIQLFMDARNDTGNAFTSVVGTKYFNGGYFDVDKVWIDPTWWFKSLASGYSISTEIWADGSLKVGSGTISIDSYGVGFGADLFGETLFGTMDSGATIYYETQDIPKVMEMLQNARSLGFFLIDSNATSNWLLMGLKLSFIPLVGSPLTENYRTAIA